MIIESPEQMAKLCASWNASAQKIGFVPTMGCLHDGHLSLIRQAKADCDKVVVSIFVNPLQFGKNEDFGTYPRPFLEDQEKCKELGVDLIFHPNAAEFYRDNFLIKVDSGEIGKKYCGKSRPGFFDGVLTVVNILLNIVRPQNAYFGEKDFQQLFLLKKMVHDFRLSINIIGLPIAREANGLAMSSRNKYLNEDQGREALCLSRAIKKVKQAAEAGEKTISSLRSILETEITKSSDFTLDYAHFVDESTLIEVETEILSPTRLLLAGYIGEKPRVRLIDNDKVA